MQFAQIAEAAQARWAGAVRATSPKVGDPWLEVVVEELRPIATWLRDDAALACDYLNSICCVDYCAAEGKKIDVPPHLELVYHLSSLTHRHNLTVKVILPRWRDDKPGSLPVCASLADIWSTADWHEREVFDLSGIYFSGHPNLRRILCPEDWVGYPLRKDYEMPREYHGIRGR